MESIMPSADDHQVANMLHALGNPTRLAIIRYIVDHPGCICNDIVVRFGRAQATVSQHLAVLRKAQVLIAERDGHATCYWINHEQMPWLIDQVNQLSGLKAKQISHESYPQSSVERTS